MVFVAGATVVVGEQADNIVNKPTDRINILYIRFKGSEWRKEELQEEYR